MIDPSIVLSWNNRPRPEDGAPEPVSGVYVDVNAEMGLDYGRSLAFTDNDVGGGSEARSGPVGAQKAAIQNFIDEDKFWTDIVLPLTAAK